MPKDYKKLLKDRIIKIEKLEDDLVKKFKKVEVDLWKRLFKKLTAGLKSSDVSESDLTDIISRINQTVDSWSKTTYRKSVIDRVDEAKEIQGLSAKYFKDLEENPKGFESKIKKVEKISNSILGVTTTNKIIKGGFTDRFLNTNGISSELIDIATKSVISKEGLGELLNKLRTATVTDETQGVVNRHVRTFATDFYATHDRATSKVWADELEYNAFIYQGGLIETSRGFCKERNGKVFTREEAEQWTNETFKGKNASYSPLIDLGGYNCRHGVGWVPDGLAIQLRPDLKNNPKFQ